MNEERSRVDCTNCDGAFIATLDMALNGNHEITCPHCRHVHYRVVRDGVVTEDRYRSSAGFIYQATTSTVATITTNNATTFTAFTTASWLNRSDLTLA